MLFGSHNLYWLVTTCIHSLVGDQFLKGSQDTIVMPKTIAHVANKTLLPFLVKKGLGEDVNNVLFIDINVHRFVCNSSHEDSTLPHFPSLISMPLISSSF